MKKLILFLVLIGTPAFADPFSGSYPTLQIRVLWQHCFRSLVFVDKITPPGKHMILCDCVLDATRTRLNWTEFKSYDNRTELFQNLLYECTEVKAPIIDPV